MLMKKNGKIKITNKSYLTYHNQTRFEVTYVLHSRSEIVLESHGKTHLKVTFKNFFETLNFKKCSSQEKRGKSPYFFTSTLICSRRLK